MKRLFALLGASIGLVCAVSAPAVEARHLGSAARASSTIVLGSKSYRSPAGHGWGTVKPSKIDNGGDPSGIVYGIHWQHWGQKTATARGTTYIPRPTGNYYPPVQAQLRATDLGRCSAHGPMAYRRLSIRVPSKPGGPRKAWVPWSGSGNICKSP